ncbi:universal stress protein [Streptacidiphilus sp. N1-3]|uniref:Universal stress protein n=1 Tax=Streptacidiphilus alkalitolerans TaxID=3342712 RepID=A0ABV6X1P6_9ACTN
MTVPVGRVVVGVNGSPSSLEALRAAVDAGRRERVEVLAVLAWTPVGGETSYRRAPSSDLLALWEAQACVRLRQSFEQAFGGYPSGVAIRPVVVRAEAGHGLVSIADRPHDLLVVGAGERGWPARWFHGATCRYVVAHAGCPVLAVPPPALLRELPLRQRHRLYTASSAELQAAAPASRTTPRPDSPAAPVTDEG